MDGILNMLTIMTMVGGKGEIIIWNSEWQSNNKLACIISPSF